MAEAKAMVRVEERAGGEGAVKAEERVVERVAVTMAAAMGVPRR